MYGVPADLPIQRFVGDSLVQIRIGMDGIHLVFSRAGIIFIYGLWQLHDTDGDLIDQAQEHSDRQCYRIHNLLNTDVTDCHIAPPRSFTLKFSTGHQITIIDMLQYESCEINFEDGLTIVI